ncbi:MAG: ADP-ribose pyrophosphatase [Thermomicrobiales bacterium]|nr:MAG: ADP-ribose pyrophosphatase [Thermomicrobiales bacterium]
MPAHAPSPAQPVVISQTTGYAGKLIRVRVDQLLVGPAHTTTREIVEHPGAVAMLALTADHHLLLVRQYRHAVGSVVIEIPAGTREANESAAETARRELIEETGYAPGELREILSFYPSPGYSAECITLFLATSCQPVWSGPRGEETAEVLLVPRSELPNLLKPGPDQVHDGKTLLGLYWLMAQDWVGLEAGTLARG